jgi:putative transposase
MPKGLKRYYTGRDLHFVTCSCYRRKPLLHTPRRRDIFVRVLEEARQRYRFTVRGYVVMPEHFHMLVSEPDVGTLSTVMQVLKQRVARELLRRRKPCPDEADLWSNDALSQFWQRRFYDFNVWSRMKEREKLAYMHHNPVKRGLVERAEQWGWSSARYYAGDRSGVVKINEPIVLEPLKQEV